MLDAAIAAPDILGIALSGLTLPQKTLPPKLFYVAEGVRLFAAITRLPEYYLTRTERSLLRRIAPDLVALAETGSALIEYGASDEEKASLLLDVAGNRFSSYVPIDVAAGALSGIRARLEVRRPDLQVYPVCGDFMNSLILPGQVHKASKLGFFPGSTIGNLNPDAARAFLAHVHRSLGKSAWLIVGVDLRKSPGILIPAYDDTSGVTAAFNLNILRRLNREAAADFDVSSFAHRARWNSGESRIEMHLESLRAQTVRLAGTEIDFKPGETIHSENSYKYTVERFQALAFSSGWLAEKVWLDPQKLFSVHALRAS